MFIFFSGKRRNLLLTEETATMREMIDCNMSFRREKSLQERLDGIKQRKENKSKEMQEINNQLAQQAASEYNNDATAKAA